MPIFSRDDDAAEAESAGRATAKAARPAAKAAAALRTDDFRPGLDRVDEPPEPLLEGHLRLPAEHLLRARDVRLAHLGIVDRERLENDLARRARRAQHELRELDQRELAGVAEVDREVLLARRQQVQAADEVVDVAKAPRLRAVAEHLDRLARERLPDEGRDRAPVVRAHARAVRV